MMIKNINGYLYRITHDYSRNAEVATCINCSTMPKAYGDSVNEVIHQVEEDMAQSILNPLNPEKRIIEIFNYIL